MQLLTVCEVLREKILEFNMVKISVCIATYNGEKYIDEQLLSILKQLGPDDEVIIVDDYSKDNTVDKIRKFNDPRVNIYENEVNRSHVYSFGRAISLATNDIIFMSDQDDLWIDGRVKMMINSLEENGTLLISSNTGFMDDQGNDIPYICDGVDARNSTKHFSNVIDIFKGKTNYFGCAMAFRRDLLRTITPIPSFVESHDLWIAMAGNLARSNSHINENTLIRRVHSNNASIVQRPIHKKIWSRIIFLISIIVLTYRLKTS